MLDYIPFPSPCFNSLPFASLASILYLSIYLSVLAQLLAPAFCPRPPFASLLLYLSVLAQLLAPALVRRPVSLPVLPAAVRRHHALGALDFRSLLALRVVASPLQLLAKAHVRWPVLDVVLVAAVRRHSAPAAQRQGHHPVLLILRPARREVTDLGFVAELLRFFVELGFRFLCSERA
jgi:hypothetical protein